MNNPPQRPCPCCGEAMSAENVVCWTCYRLTLRLTPGTHTSPDGPFTVTALDVERWDEMRGAAA